VISKRKMVFNQKYHDACVAADKKAAELNEQIQAVLVMLNYQEELIGRNYQDEDLKNAYSRNLNEFERLIRVCVDRPCREDYGEE